MKIQIKRRPIDGAILIFVLQLSNAKEQKMWDLSLHMMSRWYCLHRYDALEAAHNQTSDRLLSETNRDMDQQKRLAEMEKKRRESLAVFSQTTKENQHQIEVLNKQVWMHCPPKLSPISLPDEILMGVE